MTVLQELRSTWTTGLCSKTDSCTFPIPALQGWKMPWCLSAGISSDFWWFSLDIKFAVFTNSKFHFHAFFFVCVCVCVILLRSEPIDFVWQSFQKHFRLVYNMLCNKFRNYYSILWFHITEPNILLQGTGTWKSLTVWRCTLQKCTLKWQYRKQIPHISPNATG